MSEADANEVAKPRPYGGVSATSRVAERRARLIEAGIEAFGTVGYRATSLNAISAEAGLAKRYFYESFASTEDLLCAVYGHVLAELRDRVVTHAADAANAADMVIGALDGLLSWVEDCPREARIHLFEVLGVSPKVDAAYQAATVEFAELLVFGASTTAPDLTLSEGEQRILGMLLVGGGLQLARNWILGGYQPPRADVLAQSRGLITALAAGVSSTT